MIYLHVISIIIAWGDYPDAISWSREFHGVALYSDRPSKTYEEFDFFFETAHPTKEEMEAISYIDTVLPPEDIGPVESVQRGMETPAYNQGR